jgi:hypothetical protein
MLKVASLREAHLQKFALIGRAVLDDFEILNSRPSPR